MEQLHLLFHNYHDLHDFLEKVGGFENSLNVTGFFVHVKHLDFKILLGSESLRPKLSKNVHFVGVRTPSRRSKIAKCICSRFENVKISDFHDISGLITRVNHAVLL